MAYENLLKSVEESAQERERELREKAKKQAREIRADAKKQAEEIQKNAVKEAEKSATIERNKQMYLTKGEIKEQGLRMTREGLYVRPLTRQDSGCQRCGRTKNILSYSKSWPAKQPVP